MNTAAQATPLELERLLKRLYKYFKGLKFCKIAERHAVQTNKSEDTPHTKINYNFSNPKFVPKYRILMNYFTLV